MPKQMFIPRKWINTDFGRRYYTEGWQDGIAGKANRYLAAEAGLSLIRKQGTGALTAYEDGYKAGQYALE